jgi:DNA-binding transcriptional MocR family regulator
MFVMIAFNKDNAYMELLCAFRKLIDTDFKDGGWLPPRRQMSQRFNVSSVTFVKAVKRLAIEGIIESFPRKGIYIIPEKYRPKKIGIVIRNGEESPFWTGAKIIPTILPALNEKEYMCHQLQGSSGINVASTPS